MEMASRPCALTSVAQGFTLLEILVAVMIFSVLTTTVYGAFNAFIMSASHVRQIVKQGEGAHATLQRISLDLQSIFIALPPRYQKPVLEDSQDLFRFLGSEERVESNDFSRLEFASLAHVPFGEDQRTGVTRITYYVRANEAGGFALCRSDRLRPFDPVERNGCDPVICRNIETFDLSYSDGEETSLRQWDSDADNVHYATPQAIFVTISFHVEDALETVMMGMDLPVSRKGIE